MDPRQLFMDERLTGSCVYCGSIPDTRDHVPSLILLDDPLPPDLPVVGACAECNRSFSLDEEYLACLIECVLAGTASPDGLRRDKVKRCLSRNPILAARLATSKHSDDQGRLIWQPEMGRVRKVVIKLARGHAAYELYPQIDEPSEVLFTPTVTMSVGECSTAEDVSPETLEGWPEIGTRAFLRTYGMQPDPHQVGGWVVVQPGRYRYCVVETGGVVVRMVLSEYLACIVSWE